MTTWTTPEWASVEWAKPATITGAPVEITVWVDRNGWRHLTSPEQDRRAFESASKTLDGVPWRRAPTAADWAHSTMPVSLRPPEGKPPLIKPRLTAADVDRFHTHYERGESGGI